MLIPEVKLARGPHAIQINKGILRVLKTQGAFEIAPCPFLTIPYIIAGVFILFFKLLTFEITKRSALLRVIIKKKLLYFHFVARDLEGAGFSETYWGRKLKAARI